MSIDTQATQDTLALVEKTVKSFSWQMAMMLVVLVVASLAIIKIVLTITDRAMEKAKLDRGMRTFLRSGLKVILSLVAVSVILGYLGVPMTSLVAVLSVLGLAVSLAVQGLLSNLAGGIMLLTAHPFASGDFVEAGGVSGTVREVGLVYTKLITVDNKVVYVPNGEISGKTIVNYSAEKKRRVEIKVSTSYDAPRQVVKDCILQFIGEHPKTFATPEPMVRVSNYGDNAIEYTIRCWCATGDYWDVYFDLMEGVKTAFDKVGVEMTYPHVNVHMIEK